VPIFGTMAHSFIQAHDDEAAAFVHFARSRPEHATLLIDTYDTERAAERVVALAPRLAALGVAVKGVRLDSGDLADHARKVRRILDQGGLGEVAIFASGGLDETILQRHSAARVPIDGYGIGTSLTTSQDAPALDCAYKLQEYAGKPKRKRSEGKATWPGRKQVFRRYAGDGAMAGDLLTLEGDSSSGEPLLRQVMRGGERIASPSLAEARALAATQLARLPEHLKRLATEPAYPVALAARLRALAGEVDRAEGGGR
jgi:nicotinate phosphoribosyltransferase